MSGHRMSGDRKVRAISAGMLRVSPADRAHLSL